ncbi:hypothetical protein GVX81_10830, partial [[Haemophilus] felis]|nr:hypothetical protein [[Haemophilus] felis]
IKNITEEIPELNIPAHILWGAIEAELTGGKAATGAIAAGVGELSAPILSQALYGNKKTNELTDAEKQQVLNLSKLVAGIASSLTATGNSAENLVTISQGMKIAENAVENNHLGVMLLRGCLSVSLCRNQVIKEALIASGGLVTGGIIADNLLKNLSAEEAEHLMTLLMMGNNVITQKYIQSLTLKYDVLNPDDIPRLEGYPAPQPSEPIILVYPENRQNPSDNTLTTPIYNSDKEDSTLVGGEINVGDWRDSVLDARNKDTIEPARRLGYKDRIPPQKAPFNSHGQPVYSNGKNYITPDIDGHNVSDGWKMFDKKGKRLGTYDKNLNRIKD